MYINEKVGQINGKKRLDSDDKYVLDLVSEILDKEYIWQATFDGLLGDRGKNGCSF